MADCLCCFDILNNEGEGNVNSACIEIVPFFLSVDGDQLMVGQNYKLNRK